MNKTIELEKKLERVSANKDQIELLNELAWELRSVNENRARELSEKAYRLAESEAGTQKDLFRQDQAASLVTLGVLDRYEGNLEGALSNLYNALALIEGRSLSKINCEALTSIAWVYAHLGEYPLAAEFAGRAVNLARQLKLNNNLASALDAQAYLYYLSGEPDQALSRFSEALNIVNKTLDLHIECFVRNNMSLAYMAVGKFDEAVASAHESLRIAQEQVFHYQELNVGDTISEIYLAMGKYEEAEELLTGLLKKAQKYNSDFFQVYILSNLGNAYLMQKDYEQAESYLQRALLAAATTGARSSEAKCHRLISEVYEHKELFDKALDHFKKFHRLNEEIIGEKVTKRLSAHNLAHELEISRHEAEIEKLRAAELLREIEDHKQAQANLEKLASLDPLTEIYNRRHFYNLALGEIERSNRYHHIDSVLMLDIDNFKDINDKYGHPVGDDVICGVANLIHEILRNIDIVGRYGGEEFVVLLPETKGQAAVLVGERIRQKVSELEFSSDLGTFSITLSVGLVDSTLFKDLKDSTEILDAMLKEADNALYEAKSRGKNQVIFERI